MRHQFARGSLLLYPAYVQDYLDRVTAADVTAGNSSGLERGVTDDVSTFLQDLVAIPYLGISNGVISQAASVIKAMPIMAGARTLAGAFVPVVGPAPTNFNFNNNDYNRKTGVLGNGINKYLNSNRNNNADPQNSRHIAIYVNTLASNDNVVLMGTSNIVGRTSIVRASGIYTARMSSNTVPSGVFVSPGFLGGVRASSSISSIRSGGVTTNFSIASQVPASENLGVFANGLGGTPAACRLAFYSIGEFLDLALLDARVTTLINAYAAAIP